MRRVDVDSGAQRTMRRMGLNVNSASTSEVPEEALSEIAGQRYGDQRERLCRT